MCGSKKSEEDPGLSGDAVGLRPVDGGWVFHRGSQ